MEDIMPSFSSPGEGPVRTGARRLWLGAVTLPISMQDVADPNNVANPGNANHDAFIDNLDPRCDFAKANPRNEDSPNYGAFDKLPIYNTYLHFNADTDND